MGGGGGVEVKGWREVKGVDRETSREGGGGVRVVRECLRG